MLTLTCPQIFEILENHSLGILPLRREDGKSFLVFKLSKEGILAAKINMGFKISFVPYSHNKGMAHAVLILIFDNEEEPLSISYTFCKGDMSDHLLKLIEQGTFDIYFFDELNRELLGYKAKVSNLDDFIKNKKNYIPIPASREEKINVLHNVNEWFVSAPDRNSKNTYSIEFLEPLYSENTYFLDTTKIIGADPFSGDDFLHYSLEREEPGHFQETDIFLLLERMFSSEEIYLNPIRVDNDREIADILIITDSFIILVQAKDSPNTEQIIKSSIARKKSKTLAHFKKAVRQLEGAINHIKQCENLKIKINQRNEEISIENKTLYGLVVVKELFIDDYQDYSDPLLDLGQSTNVPCIVLDYSELHAISEKLSDQQFENLINTIYEKGKENKIFPKVRLINN